MRDRAQAVVIGGGVIGCSILYHLTKLGWSDVVLLERDELTSGSTWHAAANIHGLHDSTNVSRMQHYTMGLYKALEKETGQGCGVFQPGSLYLAQTEDRVHQLRLQEAKARLYGLNFHEVSREDAERLHPLVNYEGVRCIMWEPDGGNVDPSGVTQAYAAGARMRGADVHRFTPVTATHPQADGTWVVETPKGEIRTDWVINAAGLWAREVAAMANVYLPLQPTEHQYFVTETLQDVVAHGQRLPSVADRDGEYYLRQEGLGLLVGAYEKDVRLWAEHGTPPDFGHELFADDLDRLEDNVLRAFDRVPCLAEAGIKRVINGPMIWSPDSNALFGPVPELRNYFCCAGIIPGFSQSGGLGLRAAQWIIDGEPEHDIFAWDLARFDDWADAAFTKARVKDQYAHRFKIHFPGEEREAGRQRRKRPVYDMQSDLGAVFGLNSGWEHPLHFGGQADSAGFTRQPWWQQVGEECRMLREAAGIIDISNFAKYRVAGPGAETWLNGLFANKMPREVGRICLTPLIGYRGGIAGDFTVARMADDAFLIIGSGMAERYHRRFFSSHALPEGTAFASLTNETCGFNVAGPASREMLQRMTNCSLASDDFKFMRSQRITLAGIKVSALRLSFTGDLGWELHCDEADQINLYAALLEAGKDFGAGPVGSRALMSLRLEKGYGSWGRDYTLEHRPHEAGLAGLCKLEKSFLNSEVVQSGLNEPEREKLVLLELDSGQTNASNADASGGEPIFAGDRPIGYVTSGGYGHSVGKSLALAYLRETTVSEPLNVMVLGRPHRAVILPEPPFDPKGVRLRA